MSSALFPFSFDGLGTEHTPPSPISIEQNRFYPYAAASPRADLILDVDLAPCQWPIPQDSHHGYCDKHCAQFHYVVHTQIFLAVTASCQ